MKRTSLGELEEIVLLVTASLQEDAYGVTITQEIEKQTGRSMGFNTVHTTLQRLEEKGFISSKMGGATEERGGRRKRYFKITALGSKALKNSKELREKLWKIVPPHLLGLSRN
jgi:DNA-binding PadR family transcriptional regulator